MQNNIKLIIIHNANTYLYNLSWTNSFDLQDLKQQICKDININTENKFYINGINIDNQNSDIFENNSLIEIYLSDNNYQEINKLRYITPNNKYTENSNLEIDGPPKLTQLITKQNLQLSSLIGPIIIGLVMYAVTKNAISIVYIALSPVNTLVTYLYNKISSKIINKKISSENLKASIKYYKYIKTVKDNLYASQNTKTHIWSKRIILDNNIKINLGTKHSNLITVLPDIKHLDNLQFDIVDFIDSDKSIIEKLNTDISVMKYNTHNLEFQSEIINYLELCINSKLSHIFINELALNYSPNEVIIGGIFSPQIFKDYYNYLIYFPHTWREFSLSNLGNLGFNSPQYNELLEKLYSIYEQRAYQKNINSDNYPIIIFFIQDEIIISSKINGYIASLKTYGKKYNIHIIKLCKNTEFEKKYISENKITLKSFNMEKTIYNAKSICNIVDSFKLHRNTISFGIDSYKLSYPVFQGDISSASILDWNNDSTDIVAKIGTTNNGIYELNFTKDGPHCLIGGTTGSGKSEFITAIILSLMCNYSADKVNFLFIDYKGGAAFNGLEKLPHCIGLITDLNDHLIDKLINSLKIEIKDRETILKKYNLKNTNQLSSINIKMPDIFIVIDEFATLSKEVPHFIDSIIDLAARGRSLGLHIIMATQRPSGVIKDNIRANTNIRVSLRVLSREDSRDIIDSADAYDIPIKTPGRAYIKIGSDNPELIQSVYYGTNTILNEKNNFELIPINFNSKNKSKNIINSSHLSDIDIISSYILQANIDLNIDKPKKIYIDPLPNYVKLKNKSDNKFIYGISENVIERKWFVNKTDFKKENIIVMIGERKSGKTTLLNKIISHFKDMKIYNTKDFSSIEELITILENNKILTVLIIDNWNDILQKLNADIFSDLQKKFENIIINATKHNLKIFISHDGTTSNLGKIQKYIDTKIVFRLRSKEDIYIEEIDKSLNVENFVNGRCLINNIETQISK